MPNANGFAPVDIDLPAGFPTESGQP
jgi:hypothetical protein